MMIIPKPLWINYLYFAPVLTVHSNILLRSRKRETTINTPAGKERNEIHVKNKGGILLNRHCKVFLTQRSGRILEEVCPSPMSMVLTSLLPCPVWEVLPFMLFFLSTFQVPIEGCIALSIVPVRGTLWNWVVFSLKYFKTHNAEIVVFYSYNPLKYL